MDENLKQKYAEKIESIERWNKLDKETAHLEADRLLCALLRELGYGDVVLAWECIPKWYA